MAQQIQSQDYQLKLGVMHHSSLKTTQLIQFLQSQANQFLTQTLPQSLPKPISQHFLTTFQHLPKYVSLQQYIGILLIYNSSSVDSFQYVKDLINKIKQYDGDLFIIIVQMQTSQKKINVIKNDGINLCKNQNLIFIKLSLQNSQDLVNQINRNLYQLIENYYYPNQQQLQQIQNKDKINNNNQQYTLQYKQPVIIASKSQRLNIQNLLEKASRLRKNRQQQIIQQQKNIDNSINNVQDVLNNINRHINQKMQSGWFSKLKQSLYSPCQKNSNIFSKIKLTQEFIDDNHDIQTKKNKIKKYGTIKMQTALQNRYLSHNNTLTSRNLNYQPILKIIITIGQTNVVEFDICQNSSIQQLSKKALNQLGLRQTANNLQIIQNCINKKIEGFVKQLQKEVKNLQTKRISQRSYLNTHKTK